MDLEAETNDAGQPAEGWLRRQPVQARSEARIGQILDTVAAVVAECGLEQVTTTLVASRSCMSVGALYRYFPDRQGLVLALAQRNLERYLAELDRTVEGLSGGGWPEVLDQSIDTCVQMHVAEPGFTRLRFGWAIDRPTVEKPLCAGASSAGVLAEHLRALLVERFGVPDHPELAFHLEIVADIIDVLLARAYSVQPEGDDRLVEECRGLVHEYLCRYLPPVEARTGAAW